MTRALVVYGTQHGHGRKVAHVIGDELQRAGVQADVAQASKHVPPPGNYDGIVVVAAVHARGYQHNVRRWVRAHAATLARKPNAFVSICLGVLQHDAAVDRDLTEIRDRFYAATGWQPGLVKVVAGALPYTRYSPLTRWAMKRIVEKAHGDIDTTRDYEYTDWHDLRRFARDFAGALNASQLLAFPHDGPARNVA
jgi:menaquinone-dependent protoporphyrinogen oxidase